MFFNLRRFFFNKAKKNLYINRKTAWSRTEFLCYEILFPPNIAFRDKNASRFFFVAIMDLYTAVISHELFREPELS